MSISRTPQPSRHKASGQAVVRLNGKDFYLGSYGTPKAIAAYDRLISEWLANGRQLPNASADEPLNVEEMLARFWTFAEQHYRKNGEPTKELDNIRYALRPVRRLYGESPACEFGPLALKAVRAEMIEAGLARKVINQRIGKIKRVFRWAVSEELIPPSVYQSLAAVDGLKRGRTKARETEPVQPVPAEVVEATLPFLPQVVADMVRFQQFTGARPGEVCALRPCDVDRSGEVWKYRPAGHKTDYLGRERIIFIGPRAQQVLLPYLLRPPTCHCFSPADSMAKQKAEKRANRKSKVQPSQRDRSKRNAKRKPGNKYNRLSLLCAVRRACRRADVAAHNLTENRAVPLVRMIVPIWHPNQLRHSVATAVRREFGIEAAQVVLGHSKADVTQVYAERDFAKAAEVIKRIG